LSKKELLTCQQSETPQHKETSMHVLSSMFDNMRPLMLPHLGAIVQILSANLSHAHTLVRRGALQAIQIVFCNRTACINTCHPQAIQTIVMRDEEDDLQHVAPLIPTALSIAQQVHCPSFLCPTRFHHVRS
jgi:hypothetical protein